MRLKTIVENISRTDFFDFYALLDAYYDRNHANHDQIAAELKFLADNIIKDHLNQFANILLNRIPDPDHEPTRELLAQQGIDIDSTSEFQHLALDQKVELIRQVLVFDRKHSYTGDTWLNLAKSFLTLATIQPTLPAQIATIDKIYKSLHHGGMITDYMDESDWIEDALNYRDNANSAQTFAKASPRIRSIIGRAQYANMNSQPVPDIQKLHTALRRAASKYPGVNIDFNNNIIDVAVAFRDIYDGTSKLPTIAWGGRLPASHEQRNLRLGDWHRGELTIADHDDVMIVAAGTNQLEIQKPIDRQFEFALDLIHAAARIAAGSGLILAMDYRSKLSRRRQNKVSAG